jgi:hypothetical protein
MNEPKRLLESAGSFERSLLSALADERPSPELVRRMHQGIAFGGVAAGAKLAAAGHGALVWGGLVVAGLAAGLAASQAPPRAAPVAPVVAAAIPRPVVVAPPAESVRPLAVPPPATSVERSATPPPRSRAAPAGGGDLHDEIRLLDAARAAVRGDRASEALKLLARYERHYPKGQFRQEVLVLRVEALELAGKAESARALSKRFLSDHPESPHAERMERVTTPR